MKRQIKYLATTLIVSCLILTACNNSKKSEITTTNKQTTMDSVNLKIEANKELVRLWILDGWNNNRNKEVVDKVFAQDWVDGNPTFPDQPKGIVGAMYFVEQYRNALPDIQFNITHLIADTDYVTFRFEAQATHKGTLMGIPATGKRVTVTGIVIHKVENGRFAKSWNEVDLLGLKMQLEKK
ncbi:MAG: ester cyclase [Saprospiraceae bacterium]|nr:ester cyclase [Saprospiraceae bacterium]